MIDLTLYDECPRTIRKIEPADWALRRAEITHLYIDEGLTLHELMETLERRYGLTATANMLKKRIAAWNIRRKNNRSEVRILLKMKRERDAEGRESIFLLRGRPVDMVRVERYAKRQRISSSDVEGLIGAPPRRHPDVVCLTPDRPASPLATPRDLAAPEIMLYYVQISIQGSLEAQILFSERDDDFLTSTADGDSCDPAGIFCENMIAACDDFEAGRYEAGGLHLIAGCAVIEDLVTSNLPYNVEYAVYAISKFEWDGYADIAAEVAMQISLMAVKLLPPEHPRYRIMKAFRDVRPEEWVDLVSVVRAVTADVLQRSLGVDHVQSIRQRLDNLRLSNDSESVIETFRNTLVDSDVRFGEYSLRSLEILDQAASYCNREEDGNFALAELFSTEVLRRCQPPFTRSSEFFMCVNGLHRLVVAQLGQHKLLQGEASCLQLIELIEREEQYDDHEMLHALRLYENVLCEIGDLSKAEYVCGQRLRILRDTTVIL